MHTIRLMLLATALTFATQAANADPFSRLWVFGDSTVDTGWYKVPKKNSNPPTFTGDSRFDFYLAPTSPGGQTGAQKWGIGKPTANPEPMSVQVLAKTLGVHARPHNRKNKEGVRGTNYATSGARAKEPNVAGSGLFPNAVPVREQIEHYLNHHNLSGRALYVVSSGDNDITAALNANAGVCSAAAQATVQTAANNLANKIQALQGQNAQYIIVANLVQSFGTTDKKTCRTTYNTALTNRLNALGVHYALGDVNGVRMKIEGSSSSFGITITGNNHPACSVPPAGTNITANWSFLCSPTSPVSTPTNADVSEFADDGHWAPAAQKVLGSYYFCLAKQTWPTVFAANPASHQPPIACHLFDASWT